MRLENKVAVITGAAGGIGRSTAIAFAKEGASVLVTDINEEGGHETVKMIQDAGGEASFLPVDVTDESQCQEMVNVAVQQYGKLDIGFNNAAIVPTPGPFEDMPAEIFNSTLNVNVSGVFYCMKHQLKYMVENGGGVIINNASVTSFGGGSYLPHYCASKHAVIGLTKAAAVEYSARGIRVNAVCPGVILTDFSRGFFGGTDELVHEGGSPMSPMNRVGMPEEVAAFVTFLASDESPFISGGALTIDGAMTARFD